MRPGSASRRIVAAVAIVLLAALAACAEPRADLGVDVFSADTTAARFVVSMTGDLVVGLRSGSVYMRPDRSLVIETPGSLIIRRGAGTATLAALDSTHRLAVQPIGTPPDSTDIAGVVGSKVRMTREGKEQRVTLEVLSP